MLLKALRTLLGCGLVMFHAVLSSILPRGDDPGGHNWIDHDKVVAFTQNASADFGGQVELRFNPYLYVAGGCDPYPAVDASGNLG
ncbi:uncharacterized protein ColSpa_07708 [Colletotrichum spaethianum]|uniref:Uncharacterized protein n=1 Tax=Colletotrichum spaethianum TaxID=700344 RepID=A0AA37P8D1_9PEZI|nr:uncharacterized protein ColSpa_07708 [Colletotrichum spaethianum]GKT47527.1 hypothetical protein ColSpa_07708 [Colletotrichum spaethianum]